MTEAESDYCSTADRRSIAVGIMAYNEEGNIGLLLDSLLKQTVVDRIGRIIVIASGCTDDTCEIVARYSERYPLIELIAEQERSGKIAAINTFMSVVDEQIVVVSCGDLIFEPSTVEHLCEPFADPSIGMTGAHPMPENVQEGFVNFAVTLMWDLHHRVALRQPKMGELVAFRNILAPLDRKALCDEISIEAQIRKAGLRIIYAANATVRNQGPTTLREFFKQRCRWIAANYQVISDYKASVATMRPTLLVGATLQLMREKHLPAAWVFAVGFIELLARARAFLDYYVFRSRQKYRVWDPVVSTKILLHRASESDEERVHKMPV